MNVEVKVQSREARRASRRENPLGRFIFGALILTVGVLFWLDQMDRIDVAEYLHLWPVALIVIGLANLVQTRWVAGLIWMGLGAAFLVPGGGWESLRILLSVWPLLISLGGVTLVVHALRGRTDPDAFNAAAVMAGNVRTAASSGSAVAVMGGCQIDFGGASRASGDVYLDVLAFWGGIDIRVPAGWHVVDQVAEIFGGFEDKTVPPRDNAPRLIVRGSAIIGGVEVKSIPEAAA